MTAPATELDAGGRLAIALLVGTGVGLEREWSGQTTGPNARFAGLRTFLLLGLAGGVAGLLLTWENANAGTAVIVSAMAFTIVAYVMAVRRPPGDVGGTTEVAAMTVVALGVLAGLGSLVLAAGAGSIVVLALSEKSRLHWFVGHVSERELHATLQFAVLALVVLPIIPAGPYGGSLNVQPRAVWVIALIFSGLSFVAYLLRRALGSGAGYIITGLGVYATASLLGLTDVDALTMSMSRLGGTMTAATAASAITAGIVVNTAMKLVACSTMGEKSFRRVAVPGLIALGIATALGIAI